MPTTHVIVIDFRTGPRRWAEFDVDFSSGTISNILSAGLDGRFIATMLEWQHREFTGVIWFPWTECYPARPPLNDPQSLAWSLMAIGYKLEGDLAQYEMPKPSPIPPGAIS